MPLKKKLETRFEKNHTFLIRTLRDEFLCLRSMLARLTVARSPSIRSNYKPTIVVEDSTALQCQTGVWVTTEKCLFFWGQKVCKSFQTPSRLRVHHGICAEVRHAEYNAHVFPPRAIVTTTFFNSNHPREISTVESHVLLFFV